jgi:hypothetical protein
MRERVGLPVIFLLLLGAIALGLDMIVHFPWGRLQPAADFSPPAAGFT